MPDTSSIPITIVTACDNDYAQHTAVFLKSLFAKNPNLKCKIFIFTPDNFAHQKSLERNLGIHGKNLEFLKINLGETASLKISHPITVATYFRLFLDKLIPEHINRVLYLDSDILVTGRIEELWATNLDDYVLAAVVDAIGDKDLSVREKIGLANTSRYFNAGVLLIDLDRWRSERLGERALAFAIEHPELITWWDQCALNYAVDGRFKELAKDWNFQTHHLRWTDQRKMH